MKENSHERKKVSDSWLWACFATPAFGDSLATGGPVSSYVVPGSGRSVSLRGQPRVSAATGTATGTESHFTACTTLLSPLPLQEVVGSCYLPMSQKRKLKHTDAECLMITELKPEAEAFRLACLWCAVLLGGDRAGRAGRARQQPEGLES